MAIRRDLLGLVGALTGFLWMFLAAAPLETLADTGGLSPSTANTTIDAYHFAADWRHGMAGNSPLYMPGFFVVAVAAWAWGGSRSLGRLVVEGGGALIAGATIASALADAAAPGMAKLFEATTGARVVRPWPDPPLRAVLQALYTAATWVSVVIACRHALARRSFAPLLIVPPLTVGLVLVRPWTVDDFVALWIARAGDGDGVALASALAIPVVAWTLVWTERRAQRVHTHRKLRRMDTDV